MTFKKTVLFHNNNTPDDKSNWTGKDFEFLIRGDVQISTDDFDRIMTHFALVLNKVIKDEWTYYKVDPD